MARGNQQKGGLNCCKIGWIMVGAIPIFMFNCFNPYITSVIYKYQSLLQSLLLVSMLIEKLLYLNQNNYRQPVLDKLYSSLHRVYIQDNSKKYTLCDVADLCTLQCAFFTSCCVLPILAKEINEVTKLKCYCCTRATHCTNLQC
ncbi:Hypothetical_protein [Hexamita inflata]|uniref:Hypothetical_protein n=1 Tax=Hexamita inflata TaxID=28002 RepID=A0AA86Q0E6_9EUKA|nr:Hypothetical protein HINF_LOCUS32184 [Hexamita inflata]CAI9944540.1 Hypothetical protein HINF_LOCUS32185 [Hexamita inflata]